MHIRETHFEFLSTNQKDMIQCTMFIPQGKIRGLIQVVHGMCDCSKRYYEFMRFMTQNGYVSYTFDLIGHGQTAKNPVDRGYFHETKGFHYLINDTRKLNSIMMRTFPDHTPFLVGHSMGSLIVRLYALFFPTKGVILTGSPSPDPFLSYGIELTQLIQKIKGNRYRSKLLNHLSLGRFNRYFKPNRTKSDWLSRSKTIVDDALSYEENQFLFTTSAFLDLLKMMHLANSPKWFALYPKNLPTLLISGACDPVTNFSKGTQVIADSLKHQNVKYVHFLLYPHARHDILNEFNRYVVFQDICDWCDLF